MHGEGKENYGFAKQLLVVEPSFPAVTCVPQTTYLTGKPPSEHGIVANGFFDRSFYEVRNWHQSAKLLRHKRIFDVIKDMAQASLEGTGGIDATIISNKPFLNRGCSNNLYQLLVVLHERSKHRLLSNASSTVSVSVTFTLKILMCFDRYLQDGRMKSDLYTKPATLRDALQSRLGMFPLGKFWGPLTSIGKYAQYSFRAVANVFPKIRLHGLLMLRR